MTEADDKDSPHPLREGSGAIPGWKHDGDSGLLLPLALEDLERAAAQMARAGAMSDAVMNALVVLLNSLAGERNRWRDAQRKDDVNAAREAAGHAVRLVAEFLEQLAADDVAPEGLAEPFHRLAVALADLTAGIKNPLLHRTDWGPPRSSDLGSAKLYAAAALAMEAYMRLGRCRTAAAREVARALNRALPRRGKPIQWQTVAKWRDRCREGEGSRPPETLSLWRKGLAVMDREPTNRPSLDRIAQALLSQAAALATGFSHLPPE